MRAWFVAALLPGCAEPPRSTAPTETETEDGATGDTGSAQVEPRNALVILFDDLGVDRLALYGGADPVPTPRMDALARDGMLFRQAYAYPVCSATRAALLTGRYGRRNGFGAVLWPSRTEWELPLTEVALPELLALADPPWTSEAAGKWHLSGFVSPSGPLHPQLVGFDWYSGSLGNLYANEARVDGNDYAQWEKVLPDATFATVTDYPTTDTTDDALSRLATLPEPFFLYVAYNATHHPYDLPPSSLHSVHEPDPTRARRFAAMAEALDTEVGRLLDGIAPDVRARTLVFLLGDNGSDNDMRDPSLPAGHAKGSLFEGGTRIPMIVAGPTVAEPGSETHAVVHVVDVVPTVAALAGVDPRLAVPGGQVDGRSLLPVLRAPHTTVRELLYNEVFSPVGPGPWTRDEQAMRGDRYKLLRTEDGDQLFDLARPGLDDGPDLLRGRPTPEQLGAYARLADALEQQLAALTPP